MFEFVCRGHIYDKPEMRLVRGVCYCMSAGLSYIFLILSAYSYVMFCRLNSLLLYIFHLIY